MEQPSRKTLISYFRGQCQPHEVNLVRLYLAMEIDEEYVTSCLREAWKTTPDERDLAINEDNLENFKKQFFTAQSAIQQLPPLHNTEPSRPSKIRFLRRLQVAAAAILLMGLSISIISTMLQKTEETNIAQQESEVLPGSDKALLTLADGTTLSLSDVDNGSIIAQEGLRVEKTADGEIIYQTDERKKTSELVYNSISTPNGGQYRITLPDGSTAWLNASSSLTYPVYFSDKERRVKMTGEIYFEVSKVVNSNNERIPFFVETNKQTIQVLGTRFNVNAYIDEPYTVTTLVEGSVRVQSTDTRQSVLLQPGQQAILAEQLLVSQTGLEEALAWKNGDFIFNDEELQSILRRVARWYDVEVECPADIGKIQLTGMISRNQPLSAVIASISSIGTVQITCKERRIVVKR